MTKRGEALPRTRVNLRSDLLDELRMHGARTGRPLVGLIEEAVREYIDRPRRKGPAPLRAVRVPMAEGERAGRHAFELPDEEELDTHDARATR